MDPDEALRQIRLLIKQLRAEDTVGNPDAPLGVFRQHARDLAETVEGLDEWLTRDGFLPFDWQSEEDKAEQRALEARRAAQPEWPSFKPGPRQESSDG
jgi:hypothetical protein